MKGINAHTWFRARTGSYTRKWHLPWVIFSTPESMTPICQRYNGGVEPDPTARLPQHHERCKICTALAGNPP